MATRAREYISVITLGDLHKCQSALASFTKRIREQFHSQSDDRRGTFFGRIFLAEADIAEEGISIVEVTQHSKGLFPVLWINITFDPDRVNSVEIDRLEADFALQFLGQIDSARPFR